jgi:hypothetical protein
LGFKGRQKRDLEMQPFSFKDGPTSAWDEAVAKQWKNSFPLLVDTNLDGLAWEDNTTNIQENNEMLGEWSGGVAWIEARNPGIHNRGGCVHRTAPPC